MSVCPLNEMASVKRILLCAVLLTTSFAFAQDSSHDSIQHSSSEASFEVDSSEVLIETTTATTTTMTINETLSAPNVTFICPEGESEIVDVSFADP